eukprot:scaffold10723_cov164-Amphora_coffeaeformis.AAC.12
MFTFVALSHSQTLTVFLYLNDVEAGGGTHFSKLNQTVQPKRGRAVIWPSVLDSSPNEKDHRTDHEALPVEQGVKYGKSFMSLLLLWFAIIHVLEISHPYPFFLLTIPSHQQEPTPGFISVILKPRSRRAVINRHHIG